MIPIAIELNLAPRSPSARIQRQPGLDNHGADLSLVKSIHLYGSALSSRHRQCPESRPAGHQRSLGAGTYLQEEIAPTYSETVWL